MSNTPVVCDNCKRVVRHVSDDEFKHSDYECGEFTYNENHTIGIESCHMCSKVNTKEKLDG